MVLNILFLLNLCVRLLRLAWWDGLFRIERRTGKLIKNTRITHRVEDFVYRNDNNWSQVRYSWYQISKASILNVSPLAYEASSHAYKHIQDTWLSHEHVIVCWMYTDVLCMISLPAGPCWGTNSRNVIFSEATLLQNKRTNNVEFTCLSHCSLAAKL